MVKESGAGPETTGLPAKTGPGPEPAVKEPSAASCSLATPGAAGSAERPVRNGARLSDPVAARNVRRSMAVVVEFGRGGARMHGLFADGPGDERPATMSGSARQWVRRQWLRERVQ